MKKRIQNRQKVVVFPTECHCAVELLAIGGLQLELLAIAVEAKSLQRLETRLEMLAEKKSIEYHQICRKKI